MRKGVIVATGEPGPVQAKGGITPALMLAGAVVVLALPSAVLAITTRAHPLPDSAPRDAALDKLDPGSQPLRLARATPLRSLARGNLFPFTPAKTATQPDRSITVAVRVDPLTVRAITVGSTKRVAKAEPGTAPVGIAPTAFNLGVARGYRGFSPSLVPPVDSRGGDLPDLARYSLTPGAKPGESRFSPRIVLDERPNAGRAPRTFAGERQDRVDVGGAYRVTRNLDVTAGVRYSQEQRERLMPLTDGKQDGQAVYVGTQFRF